jgi:hypothetical protein
MAKESLTGGWWYKVSCLNEVYIFITMAFMLIKCIHHYQTMQQQLLLQFPNQSEINSRGVEFDRSLSKSTYALSNSALTGNTLLVNSNRHIY